MFHVIFNRIKIPFLSLKWQKVLPQMIDEIIIYSNIKSLNLWWDAMRHKQYLNFFPPFQMVIAKKYTINFPHMWLNHHRFDMLNVYEYFIFSQQLPKKKQSFKVWNLKDPIYKVFSAFKFNMTSKNFLSFLLQSANSENLYFIPHTMIPLK